MTINRVVAEKEDAKVREAASLPGEAELGIEDLIRFLWEQKLVIVSVTVVCTIIAIVLALTAVPIYRAETVLAPVSEDGSSAAILGGQFSGLAALAGINLGRGGMQEEALGVLRSRALTAQFIEENKLLPVLYPDLWDVKRQQWKVSNKDEIPTVWRAVSRFHEKVQTISKDPISGLVTVRIEWRDPQVAAEWATTLTRMTNEIMRRRAVLEAERTIEFLKAELRKTDVIEVQQAISRVIESQTKALALANVRQEFAFRVVDPASPPDPQYPVSPRRRLMVAVGMVLGAMLGLLLAFLNVLVRRAWKTAR